MTTPPCTLCSWPEEELPASSAEAKAFFVRQPSRPGHLAVATRRHVFSLADLTPSEAGDLFTLAREVAAAAAPILAAEKFYLAAVADVDLHFHVHLLPKVEGERPLGPFIFSESGWQGPGPAPRDRELEARIARALNG